MKMFLSSNTRVYVFVRVSVCVLVHVGVYVLLSVCVRACVCVRAYMSVSALQSHHVGCVGPPGGIEEHGDGQAAVRRTEGARRAQFRRETVHRRRRL